MTHCLRFLIGQKLNSSEILCLAGLRSTWNKLRNVTHSTGDNPDSENNTVSSSMEEQMHSIKSFAIDLELLRYGLRKSVDIIWIYKMKSLYRHKCSYVWATDTYITTSRTFPTVYPATHLCITKGKLMCSEQVPYGHQCDGWNPTKKVGKNTKMCTSKKDYSRRRNYILI